MLLTLLNWFQSLVAPAPRVESTTGIVTILEATIAPHMRTRINYAIWSEQIDHLSTGPPYYGWDNNGQLVAVPDSIIAPDGTMTAEKVHDFNSGGSPSYISKHCLPKGLPANPVSVVTSLHFKKAEYDTVYIDVFDDDNYAVGAYTLLGSGTAVIDPHGYSPCTVGIESVGDGWYRCWISFLSLVGEFGFSFKYNMDPYVGDGVSGAYVWGAQAERGSTPTAYIKTEDAQVAVFDGGDGTFLESAVAVPALSASVGTETLVG